MRKLDNKSCDGLRLSKDRFTRKLEKPVGETPNFPQLFMKVSV